MKLLISTLTMLFVIATPFILAGCATTSHASASTRSLQVEKTGKNTGKIKRVQLMERNSELYVKTTIAIGPFDHDGGARVYVDLLDSSKQVLASEYDRLKSTPNRHRSHTKQKTVIASFPMSLVEKADSVRVNYVK